MCLKSMYGMSLLQNSIFNMLSIWKKIIYSIWHVKKFIKNRLRFFEKFDHFFHQSTQYSSTITTHSFCGVSRPNFLKPSSELVFLSKYYIYYFMNWEKKRYIKKILM